MLMPIINAFFAGLILMIAIDALAEGRKGFALFGVMLFLLNVVSAYLGVVNI